MSHMLTMHCKIPGRKKLIQAISNRMGMSVTRISFRGRVKAVPDKVIKDMAEREEVMSRYEHGQESGFTLMELLLSIALLIGLIFGGLLVYAGIHFIGKYW
jgi:hypothetical protein